ncbi:MULTISPECIES: alpha/beta fold hydrolase [Pseudomonas]|jgi:pimeloyl-ACP methyl ester carboxylesterase|uniref:alpha/beta fold hydrolase n=1 Tax=Pseudomonas TaxID=286 RepID=UPI00096BC690|nr:MULTISPECIES: alpha/beta hydrolase [unclassified Pseudomonas]WEL44326.1 alpha/beta hydrolase [Pseudomonas sp. CBSPBW29]WEL65409.1 alpha/beta hydrolase [Pseudomonas sp. CBSPGW29]WEL68879.1 alpha/beta hydrolase [Pseudomonas sp. CBSPCGW29]WEL75890.1 alpha/beta hydrolase [Pseudomonas sp. CBSPAW29]WEL79874.1 alpha/beta hydrolase [Pseudomonas sp. CBSPCAW29]WEL88332.1 alpha/beta hydrolase [Pseudomonas sp. CBSPCBW29]
MRILSSLAIAMALAAPLVASAADAAKPQPGTGKSVVIVPGSFVDGSGWRVVHDILIHKGYKVTVVHQGHESLAADVAEAREVLEQQVGPVVLVGHSSGGGVISIAGDRDKVKSMVYVSALQPEVGENMSQLLSSMPAPSNDVKQTRDGHLFFDRTKFNADFAADLTTNRTDFMAASQVPATTALFGGTVWAAAWHKKPTYAVVSTEDRALSPDLQRWMYKRAGSKVTEIKASHSVYISQPEAVAKVIEDAASVIK